MKIIITEDQNILLRRYAQIKNEVYNVMDGNMYITIRKPLKADDEGPEYDGAGFSEEDRIVNGQYRVIDEGKGAE